MYFRSRRLIFEQFRRFQVGRGRSIRHIDGYVLLQRNVIREQKRIVDWPSSAGHEPFLFARCITHAGKTLVWFLGTPMSLSANRRLLPAQNVRGCNLRKALKWRSLEADTRLREVSTRQIEPSTYWLLVSRRRSPDMRESQKWWARKESNLQPTD